MDNPSERPPTSREAFDEAVELLRSDRSRGFNIDIETDTMVFEDQQAEKQSRIEFIGAISSYLKEAVPAAMMIPAMAPALMEVLMFGVRGFKVGRQLEQVFDDAADQLSELKPQQGQMGQQDKGAQAKQEQLEIKKAELAMKREDDEARLKAALEDQTIRRQADLAFEAKKLAMQVAAQNKRVLSEASEDMMGDENTPPVSMEPLTAVVDAVRGLAAAFAQAQAQNSAQFNQLTQLLAAPKRVVRGPDGRAEGVETVRLQ